MQQSDIFSNTTTLKHYKKTNKNNSNSTGRSHRTPFKHFILNLVLGREVGVLSIGHGKVPAKLPLCVIDTCAGDGIISDDVQSSPRIIEKHINYAPVKDRAYAVLYEKNIETFELLKANFGNKPNIKLVHGNVLNIKLSEYLDSNVNNQAIFINADPNSISDWPISQQLIDDMTPATTLLCTLGCNVGGLKRLAHEDRIKWFDKITPIIDSDNLPYWHDVHLYVLNRDKAQWAYLLRLPTKWALETERSIQKFANTHYPKGISSASWRRDPEQFGELLEQLFLTKKELSK